jgi:hypothetical protein
MPLADLEKLSRTVSHGGKDISILRPGIALTLYSGADLPTVMRATADVLREYFDFIPAGSIAAIYKQGADEYTPGHWVRFDADERNRLMTELLSETASPQDGGYGFVLSATLDGQAGNYGARFGGIDFTIAKEEEEDEEGDEDEDAEGEENGTSVLRLELPWNLLDDVPVDSLIDFIQRAAKNFPFSSGHAGLSFNHTVSFVPEARDWVDKLAPRFLGFDSAHPSMQHELREKTPPAHWLNLLDATLVQALGGEAKLQSELKGAEVKRLGNGVLIRGAKYPPVGDVNRGAPDIGHLPTVARAIKPIRLDEGLLAGLRDAERGKAWLERFDNLKSRDWDNG